MNKQLKSLGLVAVLTGALMGAPHAADTSTSVVARKAVTPVGTAPVISYVEAQATSGAASAGRFTVDLPGCPKGIGWWSGHARDVSGSVKLPAMTLSGRTVTVSSSGITSGTIATSDTARIMAICKMQ